MNGAFLPSLSCSICDDLNVATWRNQYGMVAERSTFCDSGGARSMAS
jgi:putative hemolysin